MQDDRLPTHDLAEAITATEAAGDWEFDAIAVSSANYALSDYLDDQAEEETFRKQAGVAAREPLSALNKSLNAVFRAWDNLCENVYARRAIIDAHLKLAGISPRGRIDTSPGDEDEPLTTQRLTPIDNAIQDFGELTELRRLNETVRTAIAEFDATPDGLPGFRRGHQSAPHEDRLITRLLKVASTVVKKQRGLSESAANDIETATEPYEIARELLSIVDITVTTKHLRNRFTVSRQFEADDA